MYNYQDLVMKVVMKNPITQEKELISIFERNGVIRPRDLEASRISREVLHRLFKKGLVHRVGYGLYRLTTAPVSEHYSLAEVCKSVPPGVVCLLSALRFHGLTTQAPHEIWIAVDNKAYVPKLAQATRFVRFSGGALTEGVETYDVDGVMVKVYCPAKTVADCFKYRNKIGLDVALEALRESQRSKLCTVDEIWHYAKVCRVSAVIRPYMEAMTL